MLTVRVYPDDGEPYDLLVRSRVILEWEAMDRRNSAVNFDTNPKMKDVYSLAYVAAKRQGKYHGSLDAWEKEVDLERLDPDTDPTQSAVLADSS